MADDQIAQIAAKQGARAVDAVYYTRGAWCKPCEECGCGALEIVRWQMLDPGRPLTVRCAGCSHEEVRITSPWFRWRELRDAKGDDDRDD